MFNAVKLLKKYTQFNPLWDRSNRDYKNFSEPCVIQVSHHPPIGAAHAENSHFTYDIVSAPKSKFLGNSVEVYPEGVDKVCLFYHMIHGAKGMEMF